MISTQRLAREVQASRAGKRTTLFVRNLTMFIVKGALRSHYGDDYSVRCLQASHAFKAVLERLGLKGDLWTGDVCFAEAFANPPHDFQFGGFWDNDHHVWLVTEFTEIVDLTVSQMHLHPVRTRPDALEIPPLWWDDVSCWPVTIRYLPKGPVRVALEGAESNDFDKFEAVLKLVVQQVLQQLDPEDVPNIPMLHGPDAMNELHDAGNPWVLGTLRYQINNVPMPDYILKRDQQIMLQWQSSQKK